MSQPVHSHTFEPVPVPTNLFVSTVFVGLVVALGVAFLLSYVRALRRVELRFSVGTLVFAFTAVVSAAFIVGFWVGLTTLEALGVFVGLLPVAGVAALVAVPKCP